MHSSAYERSNLPRKISPSRRKKRRRRRKKRKKGLETSFSRKNNSTYFDVLSHPLPDYYYIFRILRLLVYVRNSQRIGGNQRWKRGEWRTFVSFSSSTKVKSRRRLIKVSGGSEGGTTGTSHSRIPSTCVRESCRRLVLASANLPLAQFARSIQFTFSSGRKESTAPRQRRTVRRMETVRRSQLGHERRT